MNKPWLKSYPAGVSTTIKLNEYSSLVDMFDKTCKKFKEKTAFTNFGIKLSFEDIYEISKNLASFLQNELNLKKGDRVSLMMPNIHQYPISTFAILKSILSSVSAVIEVSWSASKINSTPFKSTAAAKSFNLAADTTPSVIEFSNIFDSAIFYSFSI